MSKEELHMDAAFDDKFDAIWEEQIENFPEASPLDSATYDAIAKELDFSSSSAPSYRKWFSYAAAVAGILFASYMIYWYSVSQRPPQPIPGMVTFETICTQDIRKKITLNDQSVVKLERESALTFPTVFKDSVRKVQLKGSAHFAIQRNVEKPFIVENKSLVSTVLGTSFTMTTIDSLHQIRVVLHTGKLRIANDEQTFEKILLPGDTLLYDYETKRLVQKPRATTANHVMKKRIHRATSITFENTKLNDAYQQLATRTGIPIQSAVIPETHHLYVSLSYTDASVDKILRDLSSLGGYRYTITSDTIFITTPEE